NREALPEPMRQQRERLEQVAPAATAPQWIATDFHPAFVCHAGKNATAARRPERVEVQGGRREDTDRITFTNKVAAQSSEVSFRPAQGRRVALHEMSHAHRASSLKQRSEVRGQRMRSVPCPLSSDL